jgi:hypothetical protein
MANNKNEQVVEETTKPAAEEAATQEQPKEEAPKVDLSKFESKDDDDVIKVDLSNQQKTEEDTVQESKTKEVDVQKPTETSEKVGEEGQEEKEQVVLEEITGEETKEEIETVKEEVEKAIDEAEATGKPLPESIEKLMKFMEDTGGDLEDYVKLNKDISKLDDNQVLYEYYKQTKPHLNNEEINFLMEDSFSYDEEVDEERDIKRKKLALKEQVASARAHLDGQKSKYYEEIKAGVKLTPEQQKAINFFNRYNKESEKNNKFVKNQNETFTQKTNSVFNDKFKGFEYNVGEKRFRVNVKDVDAVKETQSSAQKFMTKFVDKNNLMSDAAGYHKAIYTAMNADAIANHFYEQGKADALKNSVAKSKNIKMDPRQTHKEVKVDGFKYKILGDSSSDFKVKLKNKN